MFKKIIAVLIFGSSFSASAADFRIPGEYKVKVLKDSHNIYIAPKEKMYIQTKDCNVYIGSLETVILNIGNGDGQIIFEDGKYCNIKNISDYIKLHENDK